MAFRPKNNPQNNPLGDASSNEGISQLGIFSGANNSATDLNLDRQLEISLAKATPFGFVRTLTDNLPLLRKALFAPQAQERWDFLSVTFLIDKNPKLLEVILSLNPPCLDKDNLRNKLESRQRYMTYVAPFGEHSAASLQNAN